MEKSLKKRKVRQLTNSEKILLALLGIVILCWISYRFIYTPQTEKLASLGVEREEYEVKIEDINSTLRREKSINDEWNELNKEKERIVSTYFPTLDQAQIIYLLNELMAHENVKVDDISFSRPVMTDFQDFQVNSMDISIPYSGDYKGIVDVLNSINSSPRKITVDNLSMDRAAGEVLSGNIALKVYSLDGIAESDPEVIYVEAVSDGNKVTPFGAFKGFSDTANSVADVGSNSENGSGTVSENSSGIVSGNGSDSVSGNDNVSGSNGGFTSNDDNYVKKTDEDYIRRVMINDFEGKGYDFIPSSILVKGNVSSSSLSKSGKKSLRMEYNIVAIENDNRVYVNIAEGGSVLKYPPNVVGMWVHSYGYSPGTIGLILKGQMGEDIDVIATQGINWMGWQYIETSLPSDVNLYPLTVDKLYFQIPDNREDYGILHFDKIEAIYQKMEGETETVNSSYFFHVVQKGDTIEKISERYYGTKNYKAEIMGLNDMKTGAILLEGKVLVMKKR